MVHPKRPHKVHKQWDFVPLSSEEDSGEFDEGYDQPVFDLKDTVGQVHDEEDSDGINDDPQLGKFERQQKYMRAKMGGVEDDMHDDDYDDGDHNQMLWGSRKHMYYDGDNADAELQSSDEELLAEEEAEVLRLQKESAKYLSMEDFGIEEVCQDDESDEEPNIGVKEGRDREDDKTTILERVEKDFGGSSRAELMEFVYSCAPESVGLLSELNGAHEELETQVIPRLCEIEDRERSKSEMNYWELKRQLLLLYCQAIICYIVLKAEGRYAVRNHPVIARIAEIKHELVKTDKLVENVDDDEVLVGKEGASGGDLLSQGPILRSHHPSGLHEKDVIAVIRTFEETKASMDNHVNATVEDRKKQRCSTKISNQSMEMLKMKSALEEKVMKKYGLKSGQCTVQADKGHTDEPADTPVNVRNILKFVCSEKKSDPKISGGDDDLPEKEDIGARRHRHELRVLARAGAISADEVGGDEVMEEEEAEEAIQSNKEGKDKLTANGLRVPVLTCESEERKRRRISYEMEKNRGLTRYRKKETKNPRKKYKLKHRKAVIRRKGQVREMRKPCGPYGGEPTGINPNISRSIRFKN